LPGDHTLASGLEGTIVATHISKAGVKGMCVQSVIGPLVLTAGARKKVKALRVECGKAHKAMNKVQARHGIVREVKALQARCDCLSTLGEIILN